MTTTIDKRIYAGGWAACAICAWELFPSAVVPKPLDVVRAFEPLWRAGLLAEILSSLTTNLEAIALSTLLSLALAYVSVVEIAKPVVAFVTKLRFLGLTGLTFVFGLVLSGHELKVGLLVLGMTVFFTTSMVDEVAGIPRAQFDYARTLGMSPRQTIVEVVVLGTVDKAFTVLRQNAAMGWVMLTMVEGLVRSEGGLGALLLNENKHFKLDAVFALQLTILAIGLLQDAGIGLIRRTLCPWASLATEETR